MIDIEELKRKALAATPGPWTVDPGRTSYLASREGRAETIMHCVSGPDSVGDYEDWGYTQINANYMASVDPTTVLALIERLEAAERDAAKYRIMEASADQHTKCLLHLLGPDCRQHYVHDLDISEHEAEPHIQMLAHVLVSERPGKFALIHLVAYLLDAAIAKGKP